MVKRNSLPSFEDVAKLAEKETARLKDELRLSKQARERGDISVNSFEILDFTYRAMMYKWKAIYDIATEDFNEILEEAPINGRA